MSENSINISGLDFTKLPDDFKLDGVEDILHTSTAKKLESVNINKDKKLTLDDGLDKDETQYIMESINFDENEEISNEEINKFLKEVLQIEKPSDVQVQDMTTLVQNITLATKDIMETSGDTEKTKETEETKPADGEESEENGDSKGTLQVNVQKWGSAAEDGNQYANDCLEHIMKNYYQDLTPYSDEWYAKETEIMNANPNIYGDENGAGARQSVGGEGRRNAVIYDTDVITLPGLEAEKETDKTEEVKETDDNDKEKTEVEKESKIPKDAIEQEEREKLDNGAEIATYTDAEGNVIGKKQFNGDEVMWESTIEKTEDGGTAETKYWTDSGDVEKTIYDAEGNKTSVETAYSDGTTSKATNFKNNDDGSVNADVIYSSGDGKQIAKSTKTFHEDGSIYEEKTYTEDNRTEQITYSNTGLPKDSTIIQTDGSKAEVVYDIDGSPKTCEYYDAEGGHTGTAEYTYQEENFLITSTEYQEDGETPKTKTINKYDANGEVVDTYSVKYDESGNQVGEPEGNADLVDEAKPATPASEPEDKKDGDVNPEGDKDETVKPENGDKGSKDETIEPENKDKDAKPDGSKGENPPAGDDRTATKTTTIDGGRTKCVEYDNGDVEFFYRGSDGKFTDKPSELYTKDGMHTTMHYDDEGRITDETTYDSEQKLQHKDEYKYNEDGSYTKTITYGESGDITKTTEQYDAKGKITTRHDTFKDGREGDTTYTYNEDGSYTEKSVYSNYEGKGTNCYRNRTATYDAEGNITHEEYMINGDDKTGTQSFTIEYKNGKKISDHIEYGAGGSCDTTYTYNEDGGYTLNKTFTGREDKGANQYKTYSATYDANGTITHEECTINGDDTTGPVHHVNEYKNGKMTSKIKTEEKTGTVTKYEYYEDGKTPKTVTTTTKDGKVTTENYDDTGNLITTNSRPPHDPSQPGSEPEQPETETDKEEAELRADIAAARAQALHAAMDRVGTKPDVVEDIVNDVTGQDLVDVMNYYEETYGTSLESAIKDDFSWMTGESDLLRKLDAAKSEVAAYEKMRESNPNLAEPERTPVDKNTLYEAQLTAFKTATEDRNGTDERVLFDMFNEMNDEELKSFLEYCKGKGTDVKQKIKDETSFETQKSLIQRIETLSETEKSPETKADKETGERNQEQLQADIATSRAQALHAAMDRIGTDNETVEGIINKVTGQDLVDVINEYKRLFGTELEDAIKDDYSWMTGESSLLRKLDAAKSEVAAYQNMLESNPSLAAPKRTQVTEEDLHKAQLDAFKAATINRNGTDEKVVYQMLQNGSMTDDDIIALNEALKKEEGKDLFTIVFSEFDTNSDVLKMLERRLKKIGIVAETNTTDSNAGA